MLFGSTDDFCEAPVDDQCLAVLAEHDVPGLEIAMQDSSTVRVFDRLAYINKTTEQLPKFDANFAGGKIFCAAMLGVKTIDGIFEAVPFDEPHRIKRPPVGVLAEAIHRNYPRMFQTTSDFGLEHEPRATIFVFCEPFLNLFQCHFAIQFSIAS